MKVCGLKPCIYTSLIVTRKLQFKSSSSSLFLTRGKGQHSTEVELMPVKWFITAATHNTALLQLPTASQKWIYVVYSQERSSLHPEVILQLSAAPCTWHIPRAFFLPLHSFVLPKGKRKKEKIGGGKMLWFSLFVCFYKEKKASPGLWVKLWPTSIHSAVHYYQSNYSRQVNSALIYVNPITFFFFFLKKISSCFEWYMNTRSASQGKNLGILKVKIGLT